MYLILREFYPDHALYQNNVLFWLHSYGIETLARKTEIEFDMSIALERNFVIKSIRMPRDVTDKRQFSHEAYLYEANGEALYLKTANAYKVGEKIISWL